MFVTVVTPNPAVVGSPAVGGPTAPGPAMGTPVMASDLERNLKSLILPSANQSKPSGSTATPPGSSATPHKTSSPPPMPKIGMESHSVFNKVSVTGMIISGMRSQLANYSQS